HRADCGQQRQLHELDIGGKADGSDRGSEPARRVPAAVAADGARCGGVVSVHRVHEISVAGIDGAGAIKGVLTGVVITMIGSLIAGVGTIFNPLTMLGLLAMILATAAAFNCMMFLMMVRVEDPLVPRATFGILNTLLFFPSGSIYPVQAFPAWLRGIAF